MADIKKLDYEQVLKEVGADPGAQELALVPAEQRSLYVEIRRNNNLLRWLLRQHVDLNNTVAEHDGQLSPMKALVRTAMALLGVAGGIAAVAGVIKGWLKP